MKTRYEIHKGEFDGCQKIQYYIWDINMKRTVVLILHGGIRAAKAIRKVLAIITLTLLLAGCSPGQHHGHIYIHDPNHIEVQFDRPMSMSVDRDGVKVEASSMQPGFFEDIIKFLLLRPR